MLVNFGCVPPFSSLPFSCPMLQDHTFSSSRRPPCVSLSPHQLDFIPSQEDLESPSGIPAEAEVTVCVGLPGTGVFDFLDEWKSERERKRGRPIVEISTRTVAQWVQYSLSHGACGPKCPLNPGGARPLFPFIGWGGSGDNHTSSSAAGSVSDRPGSGGGAGPMPMSSVRSCRCYKEGTAATRAAAVIAELSAGSGLYASSYRGSWRGGREEDLVVDCSSLGVGIPGLDDVASLKRSLE